MQVKFCKMYHCAKKGHKIVVLTITLLNLSMYMTTIELFFKNVTLLQIQCFLQTVDILNRIWPLFTHSPADEVTAAEVPAAPSVRLARNTSGRFESRWSRVLVEESKSVLLKGMGGAKMGVWVAHGEGKILNKVFRSRRV